MTSFSQNDAQRDDFFLWHNAEFSPLFSKSPAVNYFDFTILKAFQLLYLFNLCSKVWKSNSVIKDQQFPLNLLFLCLFLIFVFLFHIFKIQSCYGFKKFQLTLSLIHLSQMLLQIQLQHILFNTQNPQALRFLLLKSSISVSQTNHNHFLYLIPSVIKSNVSPTDSKPACVAFQTSHLLTLPIKSSKHLDKSQTATCQSSFSQIQKVFNSASFFQVFEFTFKRNPTVTLLFITVLSSSSAICMSAIYIQQSAKHPIWFYFINICILLYLKV